MCRFKMTLAKVLLNLPNVLLDLPKVLPDPGQDCNLGFIAESVLVHLCQLVADTRFLKTVLP